MGNLIRFIFLLWALSVMMIVAAEIDCDALIEQAEELRQLREHDARAGVSGVDEALAGLSDAARLVCPAGVAQLLRARATNLTVLGDLDAALTDIDRGLAIMADSDVDAPEHVAALHLTAGVARWEREEHDLAIGHYLQSLELSEQAGDLAGAARAAGNLGNLYNTLSEFDLARDFHARALAGFEQVGNQVGQAGTLINLAALDFRQAEQAGRSGGGERVRELHLNALNYGREALALFEALENPLGIAYAANNVASALDYLDRPDESLAFHQRALDIRRDVGDLTGVIRSLTTMSGALIRLGRLDEAAELLAEAESLTPEDTPALAEDGARRQVQLAEARGDFEAALAWQKELTLLRSRISESQMGLRVEEMRLGFEAEQREQQLELLRNEAVIRELQLDRQRFASALAGTVAVGLLILLVLMVRMYRQGRTMSQALEVAARTDSLTGLANRREMDGRIADFEASAADRPDRQAALMLIDADDFKQINDRLGHQQGDEVLVRLAEVLKQTVGKRGRIARWGGEEFLVLVPDCDRQQAEDFAEELRRVVNEAHISAGGQPVTITVGVSLYTSSQSTKDALIRADAALYRGKSAGKNRVVFED